MLESNSFDDVMEAALSLPEGQRQLIADALLSSVESPQSQSWRDAWLAEVQQRRRDFEADPSSGVSWEEAKANARRRAGLA